MDNTERASAVEHFIIEEAVKAGVVREITITTPKNPNKWGKILAPWFNEQCREAKRAYKQCKTRKGKKHGDTMAAYQRFK